MHLPVTCNTGDGQGFTKRFRKMWNILCAGGCLHTACRPSTGGRSQTSPVELWSSVTWKIPLVPIQGLFLVAVTERVAGPGLPDQPHPPCPQVKTTRLFLPSSAEEAGIKLSPAERPEPSESAWDWLGWCCLRAPSPTSYSSTRSHCHSRGSCCHWISLLEVKTWLSLAGARLLLLFPLPQPGSWGCTGWSLLLSRAAAAWECPAPPHQ